MDDPLIYVRALHFAATVTVAGVYLVPLTGLKGEQP
jgi:hypothetical protein